MANNRQQLRQAAKKAASTGSLTNKQVSGLKNAGVKSKGIANIQAANKKAQGTKAPNAVSNSTYGLGAQKAAAQNYKGLVAQGNTDAFNPGKAGSRMNIMADGAVGKRELNKFAKLKDIDASQARKRLSSKGAAFTAAANKRADRVFGKNNPFLAMMIGSGSGDEGLISAAQGRGKARQMQIFKDSRAYDYKNRLPDEVFQFRPKEGMQGNRPLPNVERLNQIFGNPIVGEKAAGGNNRTTNNATNQTTAPEQLIPEELPEEPVTPETGMMAGGGLGAAGAAKLGRARSRLQRLGILGQGTGLLGRGLQYGNSLNA